MPTLNIQHIFSNFSWYQTHYLSIIKDPSQYYQTVETAQIYFGFVSEQKLYLGDLLQLWFAHKWIDGDVGLLSLEGKNLWQPVQRIQSGNELYLFSISSNGLQKHSTALAWSTHEQAIVTVTLTQTLAYYLSFIALERPKHSS